jgi:hypothetical protein
MEKRIYFSSHAKLRMLLRGAEENEVILTIRSSKWELINRGRHHCHHQFDFNGTSPINNKFYKYKTVDVIFAEEPTEIIVITVKVYYHN